MVPNIIIDIFGVEAALLIVYTSYLCLYICHYSLYYQGPYQTSSYS